MQATLKLARIHDLDMREGMAGHKVLKHGGPKDGWWLELNHDVGVSIDDLGANADGVGDDPEWGEVAIRISLPCDPEPIFILWADGYWWWPVREDKPLREQAIAPYTDWWLEK
jgi:hypothetical protein